VFRSDATKDDKFGTLSSSQCGLVELAAVVFFRVVIPQALYTLYLLFFFLCFLIYSDLSVLRTFLSIGRLNKLTSRAIFNNWWIIKLANLFKDLDLFGMLL